MPTSKLELIQPIIHIIWQYREGIGRPIRVLDVGPGWGKYGLLIREAADPDAIIDAIEPHPVWPALNGIYRQIWSDDARFMPSGQQDDDDEWRGFASYDLILLIDVIEHFSLRDGYDLLARIPTTMILSTPATLFSTPAQSPELPPWEQHRSLWNHHNVVAAVHPRRVTFVENRHDQILALIHPPDRSV
jgi:2-polyprenyl-3-methyl-5-hydroxy-6-metoxy-1,4-benzoquinol methylase